MQNKGYKAFNKDMTCQGFQYEEGKTYTMEDKPIICQKGFHYCENPLDVLDYYDLCDSVFAEIESLGDIVMNGDEDTKRCTNKIKIGAKLDLNGLINASVDFIWNKCEIDKKYSSKLASSGYSSKLASSGYSSKLASSGDYSKLASSGYSSQLASSGDYSKLASSGGFSKLASSGAYSQLASSGGYSKLASSGGSSKLSSSGAYSQLASSGGYSKLASSGYSSKLASSGDYSQLALSGKNSVGANIGNYCKIKAKKGCWITLAEYDDNYIPICVKSAKIDGKKLKENTWYKLKDKKFVEVEK